MAPGTVRIWKGDNIFRAQGKVKWIVRMTVLAYSPTLLIAVFPYSPLSSVSTSLNHWLLVKIIT